MKVVTNFRCDTDVLDHVDTLAHEQGVDRSEIFRRFIQAGCVANPVTDEQIVAERRRAANRKAGRTPGLVIPLSPVAIAANSDAVTQASVTGATETEAKDGVEKMGIHRLRRFDPKLRAA